jgi:hypothetical protein
LGHHCLLALLLPQVLLQVLALLDQLVAILMLEH